MIIFESFLITFDASVNFKAAGAVVIISTGLKTKPSLPSLICQSTELHKIQKVTHVVIQFRFW